MDSREPWQHEYIRNKVNKENIPILDINFYWFTICPSVEFDWREHSLLHVGKSRVVHLKKKELRFSPKNSYSP